MLLPLQKLLMIFVRFEIISRYDFDQLSDKKYELT